MTKWKKQSADKYRFENEDQTVPDERVEKIPQTNIRRHKFYTFISCLLAVHCSHICAIVIILKRP